MNILVTGSAGYLGSCLCAELLSLGHNVVGIDNYTNSDETVHLRLKDYSIRGKFGGSFEFLELDVRDTYEIIRALGDNSKFDAIVHLAGLKVPSDSVRHPLTYYSNNLPGTISVCRLSGILSIPKILFSSTAAIYDEKELPPYKESSAVNPKTVYGHTKLMSETILKSFSDMSGTSVVCLRYFNPVGCHSSKLFGENKELDSSTNLMSHILRAADTGGILSIFGGDYNTKDGTCIRDFIHVSDLVDGHILALFTDIDSKFSVYNLGTGVPTTVLEIVRAFKEVTGTSFEVVMDNRREGDIPVSISCIDNAIKDLNFKPVRSVEEMCSDSWEYYKRSGTI